MKIIRNYTNILPEFQNSVLALGNFDGIHLGHCEVLKTTIAIAKEKKLPSAVMSFEPHPLKLLKDIHNVRMFSLQDKIRFIKDSGIDILFLLHFTAKFSELSASQFLKNILIDHIKINHLVTGSNFIFGKNRSGNVDYLQKQSDVLNYGFTKIIPHKCSDNNITYSSTNIRKYLKSGNISQIKHLLGRNYSITGKVVKGQNIGTQIGYHTANIELKDRFRPKFGVYAVKIHFNNSQTTHKGVANLGSRPTVPGDQELLEVHIFDFCDNIYGKKITVEFKIGRAHV